MTASLNQPSLAGRHDFEDMLDRLGFHTHLRLTGRPQVEFWAVGHTAFSSVANLAVASCAPLGHNRYHLLFFCRSSIEALSRPALASPKCEA